MPAASALPVRPRWPRRAWRPRWRRRPGHALAPRVPAPRLSGFWCPCSFAGGPGPGTLGGLTLANPGGLRLGELGGLRLAERGELRVDLRRGHAGGPGLLGVLLLRAWLTGFRARGRWGLGCAGLGVPAAHRAPG